MAKTVPKVAIRKNVYDCRQMEEKYWKDWILCYDIFIKTNGKEDKNNGKIKEWDYFKIMGGE